MVIQIRVGLLIPFCVLWICLLPGGRGVTGSLIFSKLPLDGFVVLKYSCLFWHASSCSKYCPMLLTYKGTLQVWNSGSLRYPEKPLHIWVAQSLWVLFHHTGISEATAGCTPNLMFLSIPWFFRMQELCGWLRSLEDHLEILFSHYYPITL